MRLSFSQIATYQICPKRYAYRFVEQLPEPLTHRASFGTSLHNALYRFAQLVQGERLWKSLGGEQAQPSLFGEAAPSLPSRETLLELLDAAWVNAGYVDPATMYTAKQEALQVLERWYERRAAEMFDVVAAELAFKQEIDGLQLSGRFDRIDKKDGVLFVTDYKSGAVRSQESVDADLQLGLYALVLQEQLGLDRVELGLYFLRDDVLVATKRDRQDSLESFAAIKTVGDSITAGDFHATPSAETCSYCPYRRLCPSSLAP